MSHLPHPERDVDVPEVGGEWEGVSFFLPHPTGKERLRPLVGQVGVGQPAATPPLQHGRTPPSPSSTVGGTPPPRLSGAFLILMKPCEPSNGPVVVSPSGAGGVGEGVGHGGPVGRVPDRGKRAAVPVLSSSQSFISLMMT